MKMKEENYFPANCQNPFFLFGTFFRPKKVLCAGESYLPTELPTIEASDRISDHVFLLEDDSYAIVDYESAYKSENKIKYLEYATRLAKHYFKPGQSLKIRIIVIYTCDVESANDTFKVGAITLKVEQAFLSKIDGSTELSKITEKIKKR